MLLFWNICLHLTELTKLKITKPIYENFSAIATRNRKQFSWNIFSDPPTVHLNIKVVKVPLGEKVHLNCSVSGSPIPSITWKRLDNVIHTGKILQNFL